MTIFSITNPLSGNKVRVYKHGPDCFEVEITDALQDYLGGRTCESQGEAIEYALLQT